MSHREGTTNLNWPWQHKNDNHRCIRHSLWLVICPLTSWLNLWSPHQIYFAHLFLYVEISLRLSLSPSSRVKCSHMDSLCGEVHNLPLSGAIERKKLVKSKMSSGLYGDSSTSNPYLFAHLQIWRKDRFERTRFERMARVTSVYQSFKVNGLCPLSMWHFSFFARTLCPSICFENLAAKCLFFWEAQKRRWNGTMTQEEEKNN